MLKPTIANALVYFTHRALGPIPPWEIRKRRFDEVRGAIKDALDFKRDRARRKASILEMRKQKAEAKAKKAAEI